jgi:transposase
MSKHFRPWKIDQPQLLPPSVQDFVPRDHLSRFIVELVRESLDLGEITGSYTSALGQPPFDPRLMVALLLNGYASGIYSSRRIAKACVERADFMMIAALDAPDFRTISEFRKRHLKQLAGLFVQVLKLAEKAGLVQLGHVALDGTKIKANASKHKAMSYARMKTRQAELQAEVDGWLAAAEAADAEEDRLHGSKRGDELPDWVADKQKRIARIAAAKAELEAEAKAAAEEERRIEAERQKQREAEGRKKTGRPAAPPSDEPAADEPAADEPAPKAQRNFTDPESRILKTKDGFIQGYNAQAAVDGKAQIIVAHELTTSTGDHSQLMPLIDGIQANLGRKPQQASADSGYLSEANLASLEQRGIDGYIATGRAKRPTADNGKVGGPLTQAMRKKIADGGFQTPYRLRKQIVEAVFGQIKQARGFRQFLLRGQAKVRAEWAMICTAHNLVKLARAA